MNELSQVIPDLSRNSSLIPVGETVVKEPASSGGGLSDREMGEFWGEEEYRHVGDGDHSP